MKRPLVIQKDLVETRTLEDLTEVFESIASLRISKIRNRVVASKEFFSELWQTYQALRIDPKERLKRRGHEPGERMRDVLVAVTAEGKLSGLIDEQIVEALLAAHAENQDVDIVVIGAHGQSQLQRKGVAIAAAFPMPASDEAFNTSDMIDVLNTYRRISVFYQTYESLRVQKVVRIELITAVQELSENVENTDMVIGRDYIFEPDVHKIAEYMESVMMGVALIQLIMESKLAQYANRFNTMSRAKHQASELAGSYRTQYLRSKRAQNDDRLKEVIGAARHVQGPGP